MECNVVTLLRLVIQFALLNFSIHIYEITGVAFPIQNRTWPERKIWWYLIPVLLLDVTMNIPELYSTIAHLFDLEVNTFEKMALMELYRI